MTDDVIVPEYKPDETWRRYTKRVAKLNQTSRRRVLRLLKKRARGQADA